MARILLVAPLPIDRERMGPAIRYWEFARVLSVEHAVTLVVSNEDPPQHADFDVRMAAGGDLQALLGTCPIIVVQGPALQQHPELRQVLARGEHFLVVDLYDPITLEQLAIDPGGDAGRWLHREYSTLLGEQLRLGDFFLCASERQRDFWLGGLAALGRINHDTWDGGDLRSLIDVVPFGLPSEPPPPTTAPVLKGKVPGIGPGDRVILWGGGLWDWLDPLTPVRAMKAVADQHPDARLVFFQSARARMPMFHRTVEVATELGLLGQSVILVPWLAPDDWAACLGEADVGLSFHPAGIETRFAFRTRLLDYIWAGLPVVTGAGDVLGEVIASRGLGHVVQPGDEAGLVAALVALLSEPAPRQARAEAFHHVAEGFRWDRVTAPLVEYCREPRRAGDARPTHERWDQVERDQLLSELAHAQRRAAQTLEEVQRLRASVGDLAGRLEASQAQLEAAMNGRVMRLLTGLQRRARALQRLGRAADPEGKTEDPDG